MSDRDPREGQFGLPPLPDEDRRDEQEAVGVASFLLSLRSRGIRDTALLRAMELVPRDVFAPRRFSDLSRTDVSLPLPCGQTMTAPRTVAAMLVELGVREGQRILEVGTGTGYVSALLARLGAEVHSVERFNTLAESAGQHLKIVEARGVRIEVGDGLAPRPRERFDRILLNGAAASIPPAVTSLLAPGGRLVGALAVEGAPRLVRIERLEDGELRQELGIGLRISPLVSGVAQTL
ncbi:protein-L-isoaspartate O-methyltransferase family protein [Microvirga lenta]|uniref:protein-L-isoaspartate O-methyltransferase family protein n=1 Tax=Microvirga lenta TaxID=2881337 RepID=UPI001CFFEF0D|nr:protein-L-isoaspartate O-methyltransferase [Microvirga lenta]MCB5177000.1 protein-L-isoaspartate O-methyltransferase [Microvirga lenta]